MKIMEETVQEKIIPLVTRLGNTYITHRLRYDHDPTEYVVFAENDREYISYIYNTVGGGLFAGVYQFKDQLNQQEAYENYRKR